MRSVVAINHLLLAADESGAFRAIEYDLPETPFEWMLYLGAFALVVAIGIYVYIKDTADLHGFWKAWLLLLRISVLAGLVVIAINPQERTQKLAFRPSQVAVLIDKSLSMQFPESQPASALAPVSGDPGVDGGPAAAGGETRAEAIRKLLADSELVGELQKHHNVRVYTFGAQLSGEHHTFRSQDPRALKMLSASPITEDEGRGADDPATASGSRAETSNESGPDWAEIVRPTGHETRLGESLLDLIRAINDRSLSGVVVLSDGGLNAGLDAQSAVDLARSSKTRIVTVGVGSTEQPVNLQVAAMQSPSDVHTGDPFEIAVFLQAQGLTGRGAIVELLSRPDNVDGEPTLLATKEVTLLEDGVPIRVPFEQEPGEAGSYEFFARARPATRILELSDDDNERRRSINVVDRKTKVLLIAGGPMRDYRFVRNMLYRHSAVETYLWLQTADPGGAVSQESNLLLNEFPKNKEELYQYDVILAFDPDWRVLSDEQVALMSEWVFAQAGGLILVAGDVYLPEVAGSDRMAKLLELYPVIPHSFLVDTGNDRPVTQSWPFDMTREGREAGFLQVTDDPIGSAQVWKDFTGVYSCYPTSGAKAGATIYSHFSDPRADIGSGRPILLASQYYGAGRVIYLGSPEMWRLRAIDEEYYERFWTKSIREAGQARLKRGNNRGSVLLERTQYILGQTVRVRAQVLDPQFNPLDEPSINVEIYDPDGRPRIPPMRMDPDASRPGQYVGNFRVGRAGVWRIELPLPQSREHLVEKVDVVLPNLETDNARQNAQLLRLIAEDTGGAYFTLKEAAAEVPKRLPNMGEEFQIDQQLETLWDRRWVMWLIVGVLSVEWLTRKLLKLA